MALSVEGRPHSVEHAVKSPANVSELDGVEESRAKFQEIKAAILDIRGQIDQLSK